MSFDTVLAEKLLKNDHELKSGTQLHKHYGKLVDMLKSKYVSMQLSNNKKVKSLMKTLQKLSAD